MRVYTPHHIDVFKDEYHLNNNQQEESLDEARDMMKYKPIKQTTSTTTQTKELNQREADRILFYDHYNKWREETVFCSFSYQREDNDHYKAILEMGRRAVPFIYEMAKNNGPFLYNVLEKIYNCSFCKGANSIAEAEEIFEQQKQKWFQLIEKEGDI